MKHQISWKKIVLLGMIPVLILASVGSLVQYQKTLKKTLAEKTQVDLERYTSQSMILIHSAIQDHFDQLDTVVAAAELYSGTQDEKIVQLLSNYNRQDVNRHLGIAGEDGILYQGNGIQIDISKRDYFKKAMGGDTVISNVLQTPLSEAGDAIALAKPIYEGGKVKGVACAEYEVGAFSELLGNSQFNGTGATLMMQKDGVMVSSYEGMQEYATFYEMLKQMEFQDNKSLEKFKEAVQNGEEGLLTYYRNGKARYIYYKPAQINDWYIISLVLADSLDAQFHTINRQSIFLMVFNLICYGALALLFVGLIYFVRKEQEQHQRDGLTGLLNKGAMRTKVEQYLRRDGKQGKHAVLFLDVDNFKQVNDTLGHQTGDALLRELAEECQRTFRTTDLLCRFGGDEFIILMKDIPAAEEVAQKAGSLCGRLKAVLPESSSVSIGIACYPDHGRTYDLLTSRADHALYEAKEHGKDGFAFYHG